MTFTVMNQAIMILIDIRRKHRLNNSFEELKDYITDFDISLRQYYFSLGIEKGHSNKNAIKIKPNTSFTLAYHTLLFIKIAKLSKKNYLKV